VIVQFLLGHLLGTVALGHFVLARRMLEQVTGLLVNPLTRVAMPAVAALCEDPARLERGLARAAQAAGVLAYPGFLGIAVTAPLLVPLAYGEDWTPAAGAVQLLALAGLTYPIGNLDVAILRGLGRVGLDFAFTGLAAVLLLAAVVPAAPAGIAAVAAVHLARTLVVMPIRFAVVGRVCRLDRSGETRASLAPLCASLVMVAGVHAWQEAAAGMHPPLLLAGSVAGGVAIYGFCLTVLARPLAAEALAAVAPAFGRGRQAALPPAE
jgi:PST family polysaccharide transporter